VISVYLYFVDYIAIHSRKKIVKEDGTLVTGDIYISVFIRNGPNFGHFFRQIPVMQKKKIF